MSQDSTPPGETDFQAIQVVIVDADGRIASFNRAWSQCIRLGFGQDPAVGETLDIIGNRGEDDLNVKSVLRIAAAAKQLFSTAHVERELECVYRLADKQRFFRVSLCRLESPRPQIVISQREDTRNADSDIDATPDDARFRAIVLAQEDLVCRFRPDTSLTFVNEAYCRFVGKSAEELLGRKFLELVPERLHEDIRQHLASIETTPKKKQLELIAPDGASLWLEWLDIAIRNDEGNTVEFQSVGRDITHAKKTEQELLAKGSQLEATQRMARIGTWEVDAATRTIQWSEQSARIMGFEPTDPAPSYANFLALVQPDHRRQVDDSFAAALAGDVPIELDASLKTAGGEIRHVYIVGKCLRDADTDVQKVSGMIQDISERKRAEERLRLSESDRQAKQTFISSIMQTASNVYYVYDMERRSIIFANERVADMLGYTAEEMQLLPGGMLALVHADDLHRAMSSIQKLLEANDNELISCEFRVRHKTARYIWLSVIEKVFKRNAEGRVIQSHGSAFDISAQKQVQQKLELAKEKAEQAAQAKDEFLANITHELRTPLNGVMGMTHLLLESEPREDQNSYLATLQFSANSLLQLVDNLLNFNKIQEGKIEIEKTEFNLRELVVDIKNALAPRAQQKSIGLDAQFDKALREIYVGDPVRISQILNNLASNAVKFTDDGSVSIEIDVTTVDDAGSEIRFQVVDTGIGIPDDKRDVIFDRFSQASSDTTRRFGGSGLGLAITKKLLELLDSSIQLESRLGQGSRFYFTLRLEHQTKTHKTLRQAVQTGSAPRQFNGIRVLLVEDNDANRVLAKHLLERLKIDVACAINGEQALAKVQEEDFELVLMDLQMPTMDGYTAARSIRALPDPRFQHLPIVALTAAVVRGIEEKVRAAGMNDYVAKPINPEILAAKIEEYVQRF